MSDYRCRVSEDELAHDHAQIEITAEDEREEARQEFLRFFRQTANMAETLLQDKRFQPDYDDLEAVKHLHEQLSYYKAVKGI